MSALLLVSSQSSRSLKETQHLLSLSLPPGRDSQRVAVGVGRSSNRHSPSHFSEGECAHRSVAEQEVGKKERRKVSITLPCLLAACLELGLLSQLNT